MDINEAIPVWTVTANVVFDRPFGPGGQENKIGTKHFRPGTKVYIIDWHAGMCERIVVIGLARRPRHFIKITIPVTWVENLRITRSYHPSVLRKICEHFSSNQEAVQRLTQEFAKTMLETIPHWQTEA